MKRSHIDRSSNSWLEGEKEEQHLIELHDAVDAAIIHVRYSVKKQEKDEQHVAPCPLHTLLAMATMIRWRSSFKEPASPLPAPLLLYMVRMPLEQLMSAPTHDVSSIIATNIYTAHFNLELSGIKAINTLTMLLLS